MIYPPLLRAAAFGVAVSATGLAARQCGSISDIGPEGIPLQPPKWVFPVVWTCLYATTGAAWAMGGPRADVVMFAITLLCCWWLCCYVCLRLKTLAAVSLIATTALAFATAAFLQGPAGLFLAPLAVWLAFASYLNAYEVARPGSETTDGGRV